MIVESLSSDLRAVWLDIDKCVFGPRRTVTRKKIALVVIAALGAADGFFLGFGLASVLWALLAAREFMVPTYESPLALAEARELGLVEIEP